MIDLSTLQKGDTVIFRNGGKAEIVGFSDRYYKVKHLTAPNSCREINFKDLPCELYGDDGHFHGGTSLSLMDIIQVIPAPLDWGTVKAGDEFNFLEDDGGRNVFYYISDTLHNSDYKIFSEDVYCNNMHVLNILDEGYKLTPKENNND